MKNLIKAVIAVVVLAGAAGAADTNWRLDVFNQQKAAGAKEIRLDWTLTHDDNAKTVKVTGPQLPGITVKRNSLNWVKVSLGAEDIGFRLSLSGETAALSCGSDRLVFNWREISGTVMGKPVLFSGGYPSGFTGSCITSPEIYVLNSNTVVAIYGEKRIEVSGNPDAVSLRAAACLAAAQARRVFLYMYQY